MTMTQIQVPEELFDELRKFAKRRQWSLAESFRRGAELLLQVYPDAVSKKPSYWTIPTSSEVGWRGLDAEQLRETAFTAGDPDLA